MIESLKIEATKETPEINFSPNGKLTISGISTPSNINNFYQPIFDWIQKLKEYKPENVSLDFMLDYINTSSSRVIVDMIRTVQSLKENGTNIQFTWTYDDEDEDMLELGEDFQYVTKADFLFKAVN